MTIHTEHPFAEASRDAARQLRGRLGGRVCLLTTGVGRDRVGWTVSSVALVDGPVWRAVAFVDPDGDLAERVQQTGTAVLQLLGGDDQRLADAFAGLLPAPGGVFRMGSWQQEAWGPRLTTALSWAGLELEQSRGLGWSDELVFTVAQAHAGDDADPLHHVRGRYRVFGG